MSALIQLLLFVSAFVGPEQNAGQTVVPLQQKVDALTRLERTGEAQGCEEVLAAIRTKKADAEDTLKMYLKAKIQVEDGIANDFQLLENRGLPEHKLTILKGIDASFRQLDGFRTQEARLNALIGARAREEWAFSHVSEAITAKRAQRQTP
jgi:hypothetical protein